MGAWPVEICTCPISAPEVSLADCLAAHEGVRLVHLRRVGDPDLGQDWPELLAERVDGLLGLPDIDGLGPSDMTSAVTISRAVPNISSDQPAETREFFVELLGFEVAMDLGWVVTVASPTNPSVQVTIIANDDPAAPGISVGVDDVDAVHARAVELGLEIAYPLRDEEWGVRRFMLREPSGTTVNIVSHRSRPG
jgi:catechol 2,3-dioxygenase-like lactoylglutathione lyase family enzyme